MAIGGPGMVVVVVGEEENVGRKETLRGRASETMREILGVEKMGWIHL